MLQPRFCRLVMMLLSAWMFACWMSLARFSSPMPAWINRHLNMLKATTPLDSLTLHITPCILLITRVDQQSHTTYCMHTKKLVSKCCISSNRKFRQNRTFFLVEYVQQYDADFIIGLNIIVEEHRNNALHGIL